MSNVRSIAGLDGVVAAETTLSEVDGEAGRLIVRGKELPELVGKFGYEGTAALLWDGLAEGGGDRDAVQRGMAAGRQRAFALVPAFLHAAGNLPPVEALRVALGLLGDAEPLPHHFLLTGALPTFLGAILRHHEGKAPLAPNPALTTAADTLRMITGGRGDGAHEAALDAYLTTIADHGFNASTFAARVIASTRAGMISAIIGGLCALKGPLHGGAPGPVLDMLDEIGSEANIGPWMDKNFQHGERLMGFGHRIYKVRDPRADVLKDAVAELAGNSQRMAFAARVEQGALAALRKYKPGQRLDTNVEFYTALLLEAVGVPRPAFTALFACGRVAGWTAHVLEQEKTGRIIRPQSRYIGPMPKVAA